jgi:hypothetical protein
LVVCYTEDERHARPIFLSAHARIACSEEERVFVRNVRASRNSEPIPLAVAAFKRLLQNPEGRTVIERFREQIIGADGATDIQDASHLA